MTHASRSRQTIDASAQRLLNQHPHIASVEVSFRRTIVVASAIPVPIANLTDRASIYAAIHSEHLAVAQARGATSDKAVEALIAMLA